MSLDREGFSIFLGEGGMPRRQVSKRDVCSWCGNGQNIGDYLDPN